MAIDSDIMKFWQEQFPILHKFTPSTIFAKTDLFLIGLRLDKVSSTDYRIFLEILPLWKSNYRIPSLNIELLSMKGLQIFIKCNVLRHNYDLDDAIECAHAYFDSVLREEVNVEDLMNLVDVYLNRSEHHRDVLDGTWALELKLMLASFYGNLDMINSVNKQIIKISKKWKESRFQHFYNISINEWKSNLNRMIEDRESLQEQIGRHLASKKIQKLKHIRILPQKSPVNPNLTFWSKFRNALKICKILCI